VTRRPRVPARGFAAALVVMAFAAGATALLNGCDTTKLVAPEPPLRAASAALYAIDVEFAEPLDRASAEDVSRYSLYPAGAPGSPATITGATLIDTVSLRVVQLLVPDWLGDSTTDRRLTVIQTHGVRDWFGRSTGERSVQFRTGLSYTEPMRALFDSRCNSCHDASNAGGTYRTDSYVALFGPGTSPIANVIAGNPNCLLVVKCRPGNSMYRDGELSYFDYETVLNWVTIYQARL
jgi:hypothetical protein